MEIVVWRSLSGTACAGMGGRDEFLTGYFFILKEGTFGKGHSSSISKLLYMSLEA